MALEIPSELDAIVSGFDKSDEPLDLGQLRSAISIYRDGLPKDGSAESAQLATWCELVLFVLMPSFSNIDENPWNSFFRPMSSGVRADGTSFYWPEVNLVPVEALDQWAQRARDLRHPVLKARYADAVWDLSPFITGSMKRNVDMARIAIDAYIEAAERRLEREPYQAFTGAQRALDLAAQINDPERIDAARAALLSLHRGAMASRKGYEFVRAFDHLIDHKKARTTDVEMQELVADLEKTLAWLSDPRDPSLFNPHSAKDVADRLAKYYTSKSQQEEVRRVHGVTGETFEFLAGQGDATLASAFLQDSINAYLLAGKPQEAERLRVEMQKKIGESLKEMAQIRIPLGITEDEIRERASKLILDDAAQTLVNIALAFLPDPDQVAEEVKRFADEAPLMSMLAQSIVAEDRVAAKVGSVEDDLGGRVLTHTLRVLHFHLPFLHEAMRAAIARHHLTPGDFAAWANRKGVVAPGKFGLLLAGIVAWFNRDFFKALHVLIPQVEAALRSMVDLVGRPTTKPAGTVPGVSVSINMGDILFNPDLVASLGPFGPRLALYLKVVFADPRGMNLRNEFAHGLMDADEVNEGAVLWVIHSLLVIALWQKPDGA